MKLGIYSLESHFIFEIGDRHPEAQVLYFKIISILSEIDEIKRRMTVKSPQRMTSDILNAIEAVTAEYAAVTKPLKGLISKLRAIAPGEWFYITAGEDLSLEQSMFVHEALDLLKGGTSPEEVPKKIETIRAQFVAFAGDVIRNYQMTTFSPPRKHTYGEPSKAKRICRFCSLSKETGATFKQEAHAIPEALGNKKIIAAEECDKCNETLEKSIERDLIEFLGIYRVFWGVRGKEKVPKLKFRNGIILENDGIFTLSTPDKKHLRPENRSFEIPLHALQPLNLMDVYRQLSRSAINLIPRSDLPLFTQTIAWINKTRALPAPLPKVGWRTNPQLVDHPRLTLFRRTSAESRLPFCVAELSLWTFVFVFIIPGVTTDTSEFSSQENFDHFWQTFYYHKTPGWTFLDFNDDRDRETIYRLSLKPQ